MYSDGDISQLSRWQINRTGAGAPLAATPIAPPDVQIGTSGNTGMPNVIISGASINVYSTGSTTLYGVDETIIGTTSIGLTGGTSRIRLDSTGIAAVGNFTIGAASATSISSTTAIIPGLSGTTNKPYYTTAQLAVIISGATSFSGLAETLLAL